MLTRINLASNFQTSPFSLVQQLQLLSGFVEMSQSHTTVYDLTRVACRLFMRSGVQMRVCLHSLISVGILVLISTACSASPADQIDGPDATVSQYISDSSDCITALAWLAISHEHKSTVYTDSGTVKVWFPTTDTGDSVADLLNQHCDGLLNEELVEAFQPG